MRFLNIMLILAILLAATGLTLTVLKAFNVIDISWEIAVAPALIAAIGLAVVIFLETVEAIKNENNTL